MYWKFSKKINLTTFLITHYILHYSVAKVFRWPCWSAVSLVNHYPLGHLALYRLNEGNNRSVAGTRGLDLLFFAKLRQGFPAGSGFTATYLWSGQNLWEDLAGIWRFFGSKKSSFFIFIGPRILIPKKSLCLPIFVEGKGVSDTMFYV